VVGNLSGGQRQVLSLVMATLTRSKILLLDEITAALDPKMGTMVIELVAKILQKERYTCLMITHNLHHAIAYGERLLVLKNGVFTKEYRSHEKEQLTPLTLAAEFED
jgi:putative ABC transport system ATP-binding protein